MKIELRTIDYKFADFICRNTDPGIKAILWHVTALLSLAVGKGNICLLLADIAASDYSINGSEFSIPEEKELVSVLTSSPVVGTPGDFSPLILDEKGRIYLHRYWRYEQELARIILEMASSTESLSEERLRSSLDRLFPSKDKNETDWQAVAAVAALRKRFCLISGGPGTGKTSTVVRIIAMLIEQYPEKNLRIALAAPTGKAAVRLKESILKTKESLESTDDIRQRIPSDVSTIHRLLGTIPGSVTFRYNSENPMPFDLLVVDEASMLDLPLISKLVTALKKDSRLILIGDRDQLASVEAGAVLGDISGNGRPELFSPGFCKLFADLTGKTLSAASSDEKDIWLADTMVLLKRNYRFKADSGIGLLATAINIGDGRKALDLLDDATLPGISWSSAPPPDQLKSFIKEQIIDGYIYYLNAETVEEALSRFDSFRLLSALREGPFGVTGITALVEEILSEHGLINRCSRFYKGRPVVVTANDYGMKLFNGDIGLIFPDEDGRPKACFPDPGGGVRWISPYRLPEHETVFAMTVHKSQGSEFDDILMFLPDHAASLLSRELIYTGITRARKSVSIIGERELFVAAAARRIERKSGLEDALWNTGC